MSEDKETNRTVKFVNKKSEEYQIYYANGAIGMFNPRGDIEFNFFFEHGDIPQEHVMNIEEGKLVPKADENNTETKIIREIKVGIIMTPAQAESLGNWIIEMLRSSMPNKPDVQQ